MRRSPLSLSLLSLALTITNSLFTLTLASDEPEGALFPAINGADSRASTAAAFLTSSGALLDTRQLTCPPSALLECPHGDCCRYSCCGSSCCDAGALCYNAEGDSTGLAHCCRAYVEKPCGDRCAPFQADCCGDGYYCPAGSVCSGKTQCRCLYGRSCTSGGGSDYEDDDDDDDYDDYTTTTTTRPTTTEEEYTTTTTTTRSTTTEDDDEDDDYITHIPTGTSTSLDLDEYLSSISDLESSLSEQASSTTSVGGNLDTIEDLLSSVRPAPGPTDSADSDSGSGSGSGDGDSGGTLDGRAGSFGPQGLLMGALMVGAQAILV
ncbi:hypothetical protein BJY04DRAFT_184274 [Aspergillus karnatakaensis]|uniref:uncharacterized protein n=1 Tax=Aspergillus karnatakaensis TaxID=1810916 RepID=UPI003CCCADEC